MRKRLRRKGYMRTLEAFTAVVLTFIFMMYVIPQYQGNEVRREKLNVLSNLVHDDSFRTCVLESDSVAGMNCTKNIILTVMPKTYKFRVEVNDEDSFNYSSLPAKRVFAETIVIAGNLTAYSPKYVRLYYWLKSE